MLLTLLVLAFSLSQAAGFEDGAYVEKYACEANLRAAADHGPAADYPRVQAALDDLVAHLDELDSDEGRNPMDRAELVNGIYSSMVRLDGWAFNVPRCLELVDRLPKPKPE